jgi:hypothetical protein
MTELDLTEEYEPKPKRVEVSPEHQKLLKDEIVSMAPEDKQEIMGQMKFAKGCAIFIVIAATALVVIFMLETKDLITRLLLSGATAFVAAIIVLLIRVVRKTNEKELGNNKKRVIVAPVEELRTWTENRRTTYFVVIRTEPKDLVIDIKKDLYEKLKRGDIVELHMIPGGLPLRDIVKIADAPN